MIATTESTARTDLLRWDGEVDEPYMFIPRFPDIRMTPWREEDADAAVKLYNSPNVSKWSFRRPFPYLPEHLEWQRTNLNPPARECIKNILAPLLRPPAHPSHPLPSPPSSSPVPFFPLMVVRHIPTGQMIGDFFLFQPIPDTVKSEEEEAVLFGGQAPQSLPPSQQTWELVYNLLPEWSGMGIGGAILDVVIESWVKWIGIGILKSCAEENNVGSAGLVKSRGFIKVKTSMVEWPEDKGGGKRQVNDWELRMVDHKPRSLELSKKGVTSTTCSSLGTARTDLFGWDQQVDEPFLLIPRFTDFRLTPWREGDVDDIVEMFNAPDVAKWSYGRPSPFTRDNLGWRHETAVGPAANVIETLMRPLLCPPATPLHPLPPPSSGPTPIFPLHMIRHVPSGKIIGELWILYSSNPSEAAPSRGEVHEIDLRNIPASKQTWELVYNLNPEWAGKGIAGAALDVMIESWVKWIGIGTLIADAETANTGSAGLVKSRGFVKSKTYMLKWPEAEGGEEREVNRWQLNLKNHKSRPIN